MLLIFLVVDWVETRCVVDGMSTEKKNRWAVQHNGLIVLNLRDNLNRFSWHSIAYRKRMVWENVFDALVELFDHRVDISIIKIFYFATKKALFFVKSSKSQFVFIKTKSKKVEKMSIFYQICIFFEIIRHSFFFLFLFSFFFLLLFNNSILLFIYNLFIIYLYIIYIILCVDFFKNLFVSWDLWIKK